MFIVTDLVSLNELLFFGLSGILWSFSVIKVFPVNLGTTVFM